MIKERRKFKRIRIDFGIEYNLKGSKAKPKKAKGINIGGGGIMMRVTKKLPSGTILELNLKLPSPYGTIHTDGRVIYTMDNLWNEDPPYRTGVCFTDISEKDRKNIVKFVEEKLKDLDWQHWL